MCLVLVVNYFHFNFLVTCKLVSTTRRPYIFGPTGSAGVRRDDARIHLYLRVSIRVTVVCVGKSARVLV
jgi:hypothetical protein